MHELSIALSIINLATKEAEKSNAARVSELELEIGEMAGVNIEALEFSMSIAMQNTILEGAKVRIVEIRSLAVCRDCPQFPCKELKWHLLYIQCSIRSDFSHLTEKNLFSIL